MAEMYWGWIGTTKVQMKRYGYYNSKGRYLDEESSSIWLNEQENWYILDCGYGLPNGRLASICLENGERFYT